MKRIGLLAVGLFLSVSVLAKGAEPKTFLVLFKAKELKSLNTSLKEIESQFSSAYKIRAYSGNSELALLISVPACDFDACFLGQFLVSLNENQHKTQLEDIAFRLIDMTEKQKSLDNFLTAFQSSQKKDKTAKQEKISPAP